MLQRWIHKFQCAGRGVRLGMIGQSSFTIHLPAAVLVLALAYVLKCSFWQVCVLGLCIGLVLALEIMNSTMETLARGLCKEHNPYVGDALDMASGAVLLASLTAALIGIAIFGSQLAGWFTV